MALVHWNPFRELSAFDTPFTRVIRHVTPGTDEVPREWNWMPAVDVYETDDHALVVSAELPGIESKDVSVALDNGVLTITGERKVDGEVDPERWHRSERAYGTFRRVVHAAAHCGCQSGHCGTQGRYVAGAAAVAGGGQAAPHHRHGGLGPAS